MTEEETALETARAAKPPLPPRSTPEALAADPPRLWDDPDTSPRDRKRLLRTLIADVTLLPIDHRGQVRIGVRWHTGATDEITANRKGTGRTPTTAVEIISRYGAVKTSARLAEQLNAAGLTTGKGRPWDTAAVARVRDVYSVHAPRTAAVQDGEVSIAQAAAQLGVAPKAVGNWVRKGRLPARRGAAGRWCIPWDEATQALYRQQVAHSFRIRRTRPAED
ncbi:helix-turn-helix domain-containing protein [Actinophytocola glycyrrhizae]|uniref:Helix-turn-helix domain-containing protein n=1 Tax=Actinophytocola glycyrrhizae TaxID=2044873 RepID=A0ABV9S5A1_9PSEU